ncbi:MAG: toll/interleukin-1 receptor domain-containing protein [Saprospiraceae bacterium]|nr:toll/interleukin-1 receptor domain-containing protein [Saprospiraceae bacterium]
MSKPVEIFIAYSRKDATLLAEFRVHLKPLERAGKVQIWYDGEIEPGAVWEEAIKKHLHSSHIILLLVSADAIASDYFYDKEVSDALERHRQGKASVVPMIMRPCTWDATPLAELQAIPKNGKPVTSWNDRDEAYSDAAKSLWNMVNNIERLQREQAAEALRRQQETEANRMAEERRREEDIRREREAVEQQQHREAEHRRREANERRAEYERLKAEAQIQLRRRNWPRAIRAAQAALQAAPEDADAQNLLQQAEAGSRQPVPPKQPYLQWAGLAAGVLLAVFIIVKVASGPGKKSEAEVAAREYAEAWRKAEEDNNLVAWRAFLKIYPDGDRKEAAQQRVDLLEKKLKALLNDAEVLLEIGDKAGACYNLHNALLIVPNDSDILQRIKKAGC